MDEPPHAHASETDSASDDPTVLDLVLYPHRSLSPTGFVILMSAVASLSFVIGMAFFLSGAWPILGFFGLDVALVYIAFRLNFRAARAYETIRLTAAVLEVVKVDPTGRARRYVLPPTWLAVHLEDRPPLGSRLTLRSRGKGLEVGAFLGPDEKRGLADVLRDGLRRAAMPALP